MQYQPYLYIGITPKPELRAKINEATNDELIREILTENKLWIFEREVAVFSLYRKRINSLQRVRIMHIADYYFQWVVDPIDPSDPIVTIAKSIIGTPPFDPAVFDKWWTLTPFDDEGYVRKGHADFPIGASEWFNKFDTDTESTWWSELFENKQDE
jgi:hypothetical protein